MKNIIDYFFDEEEKELINKYILFAVLTVVALIFNISAIIKLQKGEKMKKGQKKDLIATTQIKPLLIKLTGTLYHDIANKSNSEVFICQKNRYIVIY